MIECRACDFHVIKAGKLDCNLGDRLGLGKPELGTYLQPAPPEPEENIILEEEKPKDEGEEKKE